MRSIEVHDRLIPPRARSARVHHSLSARLHAGRSRRLLSRGASAMSGRSSPGSTCSLDWHGRVLVVLIGLVTPVISTAPTPPPLQVEFLQSINDDKSPLVRGYKGDEPLLVRVPRRFFESGDGCSFSDCSMLCASLLGTSMRRLHERPALTSCRMPVPQESRRTTCHRPLGSHQVRTAHVCAPRWKRLRRPLAALPCRRKQPQLDQRGRRGRSAASHSLCSCGRGASGLNRRPPSDSSLTATETKGDAASECNRI